MYNPYLDGDSFLPIEEEPSALPTSLQEPQEELQGKLSLKNLMGLKDTLMKMGDFSALGNLFSSSGEKSLPLLAESGEALSFLEGVKKKLHIEDLETGDILLVIILIYLMLEGDDKLELAITLGILGVLWYLDKKNKEGKEGE